MALEANGNGADAVMRVVPSIYLTRAIAFACALVVVGLHLRESGADAEAYAWLALQFLAYPALVWWHLRAAADPRPLVPAHLYADSFFLGLWTAALGFPEWIGFCLGFTTLLNATIVRGARGIAFAGACFAAGAAVAVAFGGLRYVPATSPLVTHLCMLVGLAYLLSVGNVAYQRTASLVEARRARRESEARYRLIAENAGDLVLMLDRVGRVLYASPSCGRVLPEDSRPGADPFRAVVEADRARARTMVHAVLEGGAARSFDLRVPAPDGGSRTLACACHPARDEHGRVSAAVIAAHDVSDLRAHEENSRLAARAFERMSEAMLITDADGRITLVNEAYCAVTGYRPEEVIGRPEREFRSALQPEAFYRAIRESLEQTGRWAGATWSQRRDGSVYREWRSVSAVRDASGAVTHEVSLFFEMGSPGTVARVA